MFDTTKARPSKDEKLAEFVKFCKSKIGYTVKAHIRLFDDHEIAKQMKSMAMYDPEANEIFVLRGSRVRADWYRSLAHELVHHGQRERGIQLSNEDGNETENEANSLAGVILREYGRLDQSIYDVPPIQRLSWGLPSTAENQPEPAEKTDSPVLPSPTDSRAGEKLT